MHATIIREYIDWQSLKMEGQTDKLLDRTLHTLALVILNPTHYTLWTTATYHPSATILT